MLTCRKCKVEKESDCFTKLNNEFINLCLECNKKASLEYYNLNKEMRNTFNKNFGKDKVVCQDCGKEYMRRCKYRHLKSVTHNARSASSKSLESNCYTFSANPTT